jgi:hypothetical protein
MLPGITPALFGKPLAQVDTYTKLLMHFNSVSPNYYFYDASLAAHGYATNVGNAYMATSSKFAGAGYLDGASYLTYPDHADWNFGVGDFTVDWWEYRTAAGYSAINRHPFSTYTAWMFGYYSAGNSQIYMSSNGGAWDIASAKSLGTQTLNAWVHCAVVRSGNTFYAFKNGVQTDTWTSSLALWAPASVLGIGFSQNAYYFIGWLDELRISKGIARWTANFTPPTAPYLPADPGTLPGPYPPATQTKSLLHFDGSFADSASGVKGNATHTWTTANGAVAITYDKKFGTGCLDANSGTISTPYHADFALGANNFTIDLWARGGAGDGQDHPLVILGDGFNSSAFLMGRDTASTFYFRAFSAQFNEFVTLAGGDLSATGWTHIAVTRSGNLWTTYIGGNLVQQKTVAGSVWAVAQPLWIGGLASGIKWGNPIDEFRFTNGQALWTSSFAPPSAPGTVQ